ncbi:MAG TPA: DUF805 domain-containing protein [Hyphomicrobium sp.]|nr:DUF805 domain-containing protein [Hyphomicrobium sp.]HRO48863.1 DUF805 domain-containing protein [Hyphomicrobium sp.]
MIEHSIDTAFSPKGRINRLAWWIGILATFGAGVLGTAVMNADTFDESANAIPHAPTMAAFLWAALAAYVATVLTLKRLDDAGRPKWLGILFGAAAAFLLAGWGIGAFSDPFAPPATSATLWLLLLTMTPALVEAAHRPSRPHPFP